MRFIKWLEASLTDTDTDNVLPLCAYVAHIFHCGQDMLKGGNRRQAAALYQRFLPCLRLQWGADDVDVKEAEALVSLCASL